MADLPKADLLAQPRSASWAVCSVNTHPSPSLSWALPHRGVRPSLLTDCVSQSDGGVQTCAGMGVPLLGYHHDITGWGRKGLMY